jgi:predicted nicotinamide N-methyase
LNHQRVKTRGFRHVETRPFRNTLRAPAREPPDVTRFASVGILVGIVTVTSEFEPAADFLAEQGIHRPRFRAVLRSLSGEGAALSALIRESGLPRKDVEAFLAALGDVMITENNVHRLREIYREPSHSPAPESEVAELLARFVADAPQAIAALDHVPATPATAARRARWLADTYDLDGARLLCLGDHDLTSLAVCATVAGTEITVVDIDDRLLRYIDETAKANGWRIRCRHADLRHGLPPDLLADADLVFTDPPYTPEGVGLFATRALQCLRAGIAGRLLLAYGHSRRHPALGAQVQAELARTGVVFEAILPDFNAYEGAQAIGSVSDLYVCQPVSPTRSKKSGARHGIYTRGGSSVEAGATAPELLDALTKTAGEDATLTMADPHRPHNADRPLAFDLSTDPGPSLARILLACNANRVAVLVSNNHPDIADAAGQRALTRLFADKYRLDYLRSTPANKYAIVLGTAVEQQNPLLTKAHGKLGNVLSTVDTETADTEDLNARLIDLPRHRIVELSTGFAPGNA